MQVQTDRTLGECVSIFQESIRKRPLKLKIFPFKSEPPQISGEMAVISASFERGEVYGSVGMQCERRGSVTVADLTTEGNVRGKLTANSMAKNIAGNLG